ncbi:MAG: metallophosphoesterase [Candidatus Bathyarchaeota archaeon]|nr:metallophosphoesterase [Candidatus Bathyarchaeota archaeon]MDH5787660.1 metallophosphoesterase [Candidatus Bathyarchaeota archaeon]
MSFLFKKKKGEATKLLFATDMHGSEGSWIKFLNASAMLKVNVAICGGDLTGKMIVPIVERENKEYDYYLMGKTHTIQSSGLEKAYKDIQGIGYYPHLTNEKEYKEMCDDPKKVDKVFHNLMVSTLKRWFDLIPKKVSNETRVVVCPGNDDRFPVDELIEDHKAVINGEAEVIDVDESHEMISCGWVNPSPWKTAREEDEDKLEERLEKYISKLKNVKSAIFNFHAPPYQTKLDEAPLLDNELNPIIQGGRIIMVPVGSKAVKKLIEKYQPFLGLHGHIHESSGSMKIGRTHCVNPGSEYAEGIIRAFLIEFKGDDLTKLQRIEG